MEATIRAGRGRIGLCSAAHLLAQLTSLPFRHAHAGSSSLAEHGSGTTPGMRDAVLVVAGGTDVLQEAVDQGWVGDVVAREVAASLLVGLKIQEGHLD